MGVIKQFTKNESGQMTVEFTVVFPILIIVAVIAVNAILFFSECAAFDRAARDAVRIHATSPTYGQGTERSLVLVQQSLDDATNREYLDCSVSVSGGSLGHVTYQATLSFSPTLFGIGLKNSVFGVPLPCLEHSVALTIDSYKPGVLL